jgi:hypothetical protein
MRAFPPFPRHIKTFGKILSEGGENRYSLLQGNTYGNKARVIPLE